MKTNRMFGIAFAVVTGFAPMAMAKPMVTESPSNEGYVVPLPKANTLADNVVVGGGSAPAPAPSTQPVVVQPTQAPAAQPVAVEPSHQTVVHESEPHNYMATIAGSAFMGAVAGALVGAAIYYLGDQNHATNIAYWAAGGVLVGTGVGLAQIMVQESRVSQATAMSSDPAPTLRLALFHTQF